MSEPFVARPVPDHPSLPPVDYFRTRGERLKEGRPPPFDGYYDKGPDAVASQDDVFPRTDGFPEPDPIRRRFKWSRERSGSE